MADPQEVEDQESEVCSNCKHDIPVSTFQLHQVHCLRRLKLCEYCNEPVPKTEMEEHYQENHVPVDCEMCKQKVPKDQLEDHQEMSCPERKVKCKFCNMDDIRSKDYESHIQHCGSRTDYCEQCNRRVMLKDMEEHKAMKCKRPESPETPPFTEDTLENVFPYAGTNHAGSHDLPRDQLPPYSYAGGYDDTYAGTHGHLYSHTGGEEGTYYNDHSPHAHNGAPPDQVQVDPQWLETIAKVTDPRDLQRLVAQNMLYTNLMKVAQGQQERAAREEGSAAGTTTGGVKDKNKNKNASEDIELARQLQDRFDRDYREQERDKALALRLQEQLNRPRGGRMDMEEESGYQHTLTSPVGSTMLPPEPPYEQQPMSDDAELARQLQEEENKKYQGQSSPGDGTSYGRQVPDKNAPYRTQSGTYSAPGTTFGPDNETGSLPGQSGGQYDAYYPADNDMGHRTRYRTGGTDQPVGTGRTYPRHLDTGSTTAQPYSTGRTYPTHLDTGSTTAKPYSTGRTYPRHLDTGSTTAQPYSTGRTYPTHLDTGGTTATQYDQHLSSPYEDDEQPRPKTPPPTRKGSKKKSGTEKRLGGRGEYDDEQGSEKVPCQFCKELFPFEEIMHHQKYCTGDYDQLQGAPVHVYPQGDHGPGHSPKDVEKILRHASLSDDETPIDTSVPCQYCKEPYQPSCIVAHQVLCEGNPDAHLKDVYRSKEPATSFVPSSTKPPQRLPPTQTLQRQALHGPPDDDDPDIPCEFCQDSFPYSRVQFHQSVCSQNPNFRERVQRRLELPATRETKDDGEEDGSTVVAVPPATDDMCPCEFCEEQIPFRELHLHQAQCEYNYSIRPKAKDTSGLTHSPKEVDIKLKPSIPKAPASKPIVGPAMTPPTTSTKHSLKPVPAVVGLEPATKRPKLSEKRLTGTRKPKMAAKFSPSTATRIPPSVTSTGATESIPSNPDSFRLPTTSSSPHGIHHFPITTTSYSDGLYESSSMPRVVEGGGRGPRQPRVSADLSSEARDRKGMPFGSSLGSHTVSAELHTTVSRAHRQPHISSQGVGDSYQTAEYSTVSSLGLQGTKLSTGNRRRVTEKHTPPTTLGAQGAGAGVATSINTSTGLVSNGHVMPPSLGAVTSTGAQTPTTRSAEYIRPSVSKAPLQPRYTRTTTSELQGAAPMGSWDHLDSRLANGAGDRGEETRLEEQIASLTISSPPRQYSTETGNFSEKTTRSRSTVASGRTTTPTKGAPKARMRATSSSSTSSKRKPGVQDTGGVPTSSSHHRPAGPYKAGKSGTSHGVPRHKTTTSPSGVSRPASQATVPRDSRLPSWDSGGRDSLDGEDTTNAPAYRNIHSPTI